MKTPIASLASSAFVLALAASVQSAIVYQNDFESGVATGFAPSPIAQAPSGTKFLGRFSGDAPTATTLTLNGLLAHAQVTVSLDLYIIQSWDGSTGPGPDRLTFSADSVAFLDATFANHSGAVQSYSDATPLGGGPFAAMTSADAVGALGYNNFGYGSDSIYNLSVTLPHTGGSLTLDFAGFNLQNLPDESWGIDNIVVQTDAVPEPATIAGIAVGLAALVRRRRKA